MNIKPQFIIICREAFLQAGNNNLNLIGIFTQLNADKLPFVFPRFSVVVNFDIDVAGDHVLRTNVIDPAGKQIAHTELPVRTTEGNWQVIANFEQMQFTSFGAYSFVLSLDGVSVGTRALELKPMLTPATGRKPSIA
jgi:hypothetical protein